MSTVSVENGTARIRFDQFDADAYKRFPEHGGCLMPDACSYYHGGVRRLKVGDRILPPKNTGAPSTARFGAAAVCRLDRVYMTSDQRAAGLYALLAPPRGRGWVYEVEPLGLIEPDPDWLGNPGVSVCAPAARVLNIVACDVVQWEGVSASQALRVLLTADHKQLLTASPSSQTKGSP